MLRWTVKKLDVRAWLASFSSTLCFSIDGREHLGSIKHGKLFSQGRLFSGVTVFVVLGFTHCLFLKGLKNPKTLKTIQFRMMDLSSPSDHNEGDTHGRFVQSFMLTGLTQVNTVK
jgi:hypothetical protein